MLCEGNTLPTTWLKQSPEIGSFGGCQALKFVCFTKFVQMKP
jgi:hypothetical protein